MAELTESKPMPTDIRTSNTYPAGTYRVRIERCHAEFMENSGDRLVVRVAYRITDDDFANAPIFDTLWIGTNEDPHADDPKTFDKFGGQRFQMLMNACDVKNCGDVVANCQALNDRHLSIKINEKEDNNGVLRNNVQAFFKMGEAESKRAGAATAAVRPNGPLPGAVPMPVRGVAGGSFD